MKKVINGLDKGTTAWCDDNDNPTLVHIKQEIGGQCESVLLFGWEIDVIHKHTRADLTRPTKDAEKLVDELIEAIRKHDACVRCGYDDYVEEYDKIINNLKSRLLSRLSLNKEVVDRINKTISAIDSVNDYLKNGQLEDAIIVVSPSDWESLKKDIEALGRG
jgi:bacterioferritin (cytochrome b1)